MAKLKRRTIKKSSVSKAVDDKKRKSDMSKHDLVPKQCKCGNWVERVKAEAEYVICWECVSRMCPPPPPKVKKEKVDTGFPRGWKWMKQFVHKDGRVFEEGVENKKLKGTLPPTPPKPKLSKYEKEQKKLEKEKKLIKKFEKKQQAKEKAKRKKAKNLKSNKFWEA